jgi:transcriptional regulator with XRE-family HTH domain
VNFNQRLFNLLEVPGRSQKELAGLLGISGRTISAWKNRGTPPPSKYIPQIAEYLGVSVEWLLTGEEHQGRNVVSGDIHGSALVQGVNSGTLIVRNGGERVLSDEAVELLRIYESLDVKKRITLLGNAFALEEEMNQSKGTGED